MSQANSARDGRKKKRPGLEEQRRAIILAAVELFAEHGSRPISVSQICAHADVSRPTFYRCFKDKDELIYTLYQDSVNRHVEEIMLAGFSSKQVSEDWIHQALDELIDSIFERSQLAELVFIESNDPNSPAYAIVNAAFERAADVLEKWIAKHSSKKPSRVFLKSVMAACQWIAHDAIRKGLTPESKAEAKAASWQLVTSVLGSVKTRRS